MEMHGDILRQQLLVPLQPGLREKQVLFAALTYSMILLSQYNTLVLMTTLVVWCPWYTIIVTAPLRDFTHNFVPKW